MIKQATSILVVLLIGPFSLAEEIMEPKTPLEKFCRGLVTTYNECIEENKGRAIGKDELRNVAIINEYFLKDFDHLVISSLKLNNAPISEPTNFNGFEARRAQLLSSYYLFKASLEEKGTSAMRAYLDKTGGKGDIVQFQNLLAERQQAFLDGADSVANEIITPALNPAAPGDTNGDFQLISVPISFKRNVGRATR